MTYRPRTEISHRNGKPFDCPCRRCDTRRKDRLAAEEQGTDWKSDPALKLDHEELAEIDRAAEEAEAKKKADAEFHDRTDGEVARELERSREQYARDRVVIDDFAKLHPEIDRSEHNAGLLLDWVRRNAKGIISNENLEAAYAATKGQIKHLEILGTLPSGEKEISLSADQYELKKASKAQLKNWIERKRKQEREQRQGVTR